MNFNRNNSQIRQCFIDKSIKEICRRRFSSNIHSGVRVKIPQNIIQSHINKAIVKQINYQPNSSPIQPISKHLLMDSKKFTKNENNIKNSEKSFLPSSFYKIKPTNQHNHATQNGKYMTSVGVQTKTTTQIDRQTSCDIFIPMKNNQSSSSSSSQSSISDESVTDINSSMSTVTSTTNSSFSETYHHNKRNQRNKNQNNNAVDTDIEQNLNYKAPLKDSGMQLLVINILKFLKEILSFYSFV